MTDELADIDIDNLAKRIHPVNNNHCFSSVDYHGVQPTGYMDNEPEPSRGVPC